MLNMSPTSELLRPPTCMQSSSEGHIHTRVQPCCSQAKPEDPQNHAQKPPGRFLESFEQVDLSGDSRKHARALAPCLSLIGLWT